MKLGFSRQSSKKSSNIKFHQNLSIGSRVGPYGQTDVSDLIVALRNFANASKNRTQKGGVKNLQQMSSESLLVNKTCRALK
jgi:hypothetical protein